MFKKKPKPRPKGPYLYLLAVFALCCVGCELTEKANDTAQDYTAKAIANRLDEYAEIEPAADPAIEQIKSTWPAAGAAIEREREAFERARPYLEALAAHYDTANPTEAQFVRDLIAEADKRIAEFQRPLFGP